MAEIKIIKFTQDEFIFNNDIFDACEQIFLSKFPLEDYFDISDYLMKKYLEVLG